jgi:hypothetical protein
MGNISAFVKQKLVIGILISQSVFKAELFDRLTREFGPADYVSEPLAFTFTHYYDAEMGPPITRYFLSFSVLVDPAELAGIKIKTNQMEDAFRRDGKRKINLDPGILNLSRFILATTKDGSHRIPLREGIYGEVTLTFEHKQFRPMPWTYPDFRSEPYLVILKTIRNLYVEQIKHI